METKKCSKCGEVKDINDFSKNGKASYCKACVMEYDKERRINKNIKTPTFIIRNRELLKVGKRECRTCEEVKDIIMFSGYIKNGKQQYKGSCKKCERKKLKEWRKKNKDKVAAYNKRASKRKAEWYSEDYSNNKVKYTKRSKERYAMADKQELTAKRHLYYSKIENREKRRMRTLEYQNTRYKTDLHFKLKACLAATMRQAFKNQGTYKNNKTMNLIGCTKEDVKLHIEKQFTIGMTWENYGLYGWHIDHIRPCASFDLTDPEQQKQCFHYTNLQPLWAKDNLSKGDKWEPENATPVF